MPRDSVEGRASEASSLLLRVVPVPVPAPCQWVPPSQWGGQCVPVSLAPLRGTGPVPPGAAAGLGFGGSGGSPGTSAPQLCGVSAVTHLAKRCPGQEGHILGREAAGVMEVAGPRQLPSLPPVPRVWVPVGQGTWGPSGAPLSPHLRVLQGAATGLRGTSSGNGARGQGQGPQGDRDTCRRVSLQALTGCHRALPSHGLTHAPSCLGLSVPWGRPRSVCPALSLSPSAHPFGPVAEVGRTGACPRLVGRRDHPCLLPPRRCLGNKYLLVQK